MKGLGRSGNRPSFVKPLIIHYQSAEPVIPDTVNNGITFRRTTVAPWGEGIAQGISYAQTVDGLTLANIRKRPHLPRVRPFRRTQ